MSLGLITCYFNPGHNPFQLENYITFVEGLGSYANRLLTVCLDFGDRTKLPNKGNVIHLKGNPDCHSLWQKEALLNIALKCSDSDFDSIAWLDADIVFDRMDWMGKAEHLLSRGHSVLQLFNKCTYLGETGRPDVKRVGVVAGNKTRSGCYGMAWAARREALFKGLFDSCITGSGDAYMAEGWFGRIQQRRTMASPAMFTKFKNWIGPKRIKVGYVPVGITHLFHGPLSQRRYGYRLKLMKEHNYDPDKDIKKEDSGILRWTNNNPALREAVTNWIQERLYA